jgi:serine/threonine protein kinase
MAIASLPFLLAESYDDIKRPQSVAGYSEATTTESTPRERRPSKSSRRPSKESVCSEPGYPSHSQSVLQDLHLVLARLGKDDLQALMGMRDALDAKCKELAAETENQVIYEKLPSIPHTPDGDSMLSALGNWDVGREIGSGRYAKVFRATHRSSGNDDVVKVIEKSAICSEEEWQDVSNEHDALCTVGQHPNIAGLTGALQSEKRVYFFMEFVRGKELFDFLKLRQQNNTPVPKHAFDQIFCSISSALSSIHSSGICHRDIKPENIIVQQDYVAKLVDFGCACPRTQLDNQCVGTPPLIAPECWAGTAQDGAQADVWSFGVVVLEMLDGLRVLSKALGWELKETPPQECGKQLSTLFADPVKGLAHVRSFGIGSSEFEGEDMLASMLHANPSQRPIAEALREAPWINQFKRTVSV